MAPATALLDDRLYVFEAVGLLLGQEEVPAEQQSAALSALLQPLTAQGCMSCPIQGPLHVPFMLLPCSGSSSLLYAACSMHLTVLNHKGAVCDVGVRLKCCPASLSWQALGPCLQQPLNALHSPALLQGPDQGPCLFTCTHVSPADHIAAVLLRPSLHSTPPHPLADDSSVPLQCPIQSTECVVALTSSLQPSTKAHLPGITI
eukprot:1137066-Pelagomonas_calceolata.AAC.3